MVIVMRQSAKKHSVKNKRLNKKGFLKKPFLFQGRTKIIDHRR